MPQDVSRLRALAIAVAIIACAVALQWSLRPFAGTRVPFGFFFPAVGLAAVWLGPRLAILVLLAGVVHSFYWFDAATTSYVLDAGDWAGIATYVAAGGILLVIGVRVRVMRVRMREAEAKLALQVRDLQALQDLGARVMSMHDMKNQLQAIVETMCELLCADQGVVTVTDVEGNAQDESENVVASVGEAAPGACVHTRALVSMQGDVFGAISLHFDAQTVLTERDDQVANLCTQMASVLAERQMLLADAMQLSRQVEVALESSAVPFCLLHPVMDNNGALADFTWEYLNGAARRALQLEETALVGHSARETFPSAWQEPGFIDHLASVLQSGRTLEFELEVQAQPSHPWFRVIASPCEGGLAMWFSNITQRKEQEQALRDADRRKDEFLATLAHELRNPLAPIRQATVIARAPAAKPEQRNWSLEVIDRQVGHMSLLLDDLLDVSRITRGKLELRRAPTELGAVVESALEATRPVFESRKQQLHVQPPPAEVWCDIDAMRISQVLGNLLTNASKYTPAAGNIWLAAGKDGEWAVISVRDDGVGIPPASLDAIFDMFTQLRNPQSSTAVGLGIGLALARGLAQMHGATLTAHSEGAGHGSTFTLRIPTCAAPQTPREAAPVAPASTRMRRVLVADDNRDAAESLAEVLRMHGHDVALAFDGRTALDKFRERSCEIALLDIGMPGMSGNEVAAAIRALPDGRETTLVAITGWGQERDRAAAREAGFDHHFTKPVNPQEVLELVAHAERVAPV
jgi:signal transduction histidine kinase/ActR/RegA family two-component response regulator